MADLTAREGNPSSALSNAYQQLLAIENGSQFIKTVDGIVRPYIGKGFSQKNYRKLMNELERMNRELADPIPEMQKYITNFILKGAGHGVVDPTRERRRGSHVEHVGDPATAEIMTMAALMEEDDIDDNFKEFIALANKKGLALVLD